MKKKTLYLIVLFKLLFSSGSAQRYVDGSGVCGGNSPCYTTILAAVTAASSGEIVNVYPGTYNELVTIDKPLTLQSVSGPSVTTLQYTTPGYYIAPIMIVADNGSHSAGVTIGGASGKGFKIIGCDVTNDAAGGNFESAAIIIGSTSSNTISNITISYNEIEAGGDLALLTYFKPDDTYTNLIVTNNKFTGKTYVGTPQSGGYFSHGNVPRYVIGVNPGTTNFVFEKNQILTTSGEVVSGTDIGRGSVYAAPKGGSIKNNIFSPSFANNTSNHSILRLGGSNIVIECNYFSMQNSNNAPLYILPASSPVSYNVTTTAASNTFVNPGGVIVSDFIVKNTLSTGTPANSSYPAPGCSLLPVGGIRLTIQKRDAFSCIVLWSSINELNIKEFVLETSTDGISFFAERVVPSKGNGNQEYTVIYERNHQSLQTFFRIKAIDADGKTAQYSSVSKISWKQQRTHVYPNPAADYLVIESKDFSPGDIFLIFDHAGKIVLQKNLTHSVERISVNSLSQGIYYYKQLNKEGNLLNTGKFIKISD
ncbi:MAG: T9SS type A sorting domain-containing protein [Chitinophagaceae bacterium]|nr:T9SS type A sorting domain-containing protein [Chitinophagaceae bacterium]